MPSGRLRLNLMDKQMFHNAWSSAIIANIWFDAVTAWSGDQAALHRVFNGFSSNLTLYFSMCGNACLYMCYAAPVSIFMSWANARGSCGRSHVPLSLPVRASVLRHQAGPAAPPDDEGVAAGSAQAAHFSARGSAELWITAQAQAGLWQRAHQSCHDDRGLDLHWRGQHRWPTSQAQNTWTQIKHLHNKSAPLSGSVALRTMVSNFEQHLKVVSWNNLPSGGLKLKEREWESKKMRSATIGSLLKVSLRCIMRQQCKSAYIPVWPREKSDHPCYYSVQLESKPCQTA